MAISVLEQRDALGVGDGRLFINGAWVDASDGGTYTHVHPASNEEVTRFAVATAEDVDRAVRAARTAFDEGPWPGMNAKDRIRILRRLIDLIRDDIDRLNRTQTLDNGMPMAFATNIYQVGAEIAADVFDYHTGWIDKLSGQTLPTYTGSASQVLTLREPVGVVGAIIPWNAPLFLFAQKVAPALAAGCTIVLKPSEYATLVTLRLTELVEEARIPPGVFNLIPGTGEVAGEALITHPMVDKITFTGSRRVGQRILHAAADGVKRTALELGGKSPNIIFPDVDLDAAAAQAMGMVSMGLSGQGCVCHTRALVHADIYDAIVEKCAFWAGFATMGDPYAMETTSGPIINATQLDRVLGYIDRGREEGARLVAGGGRANGDLAAGNFVQPTLFADVDNAMTIAQEEIFGPVLAVVPFRDEDEAIRLANESEYGLGASVMTGDVRRAMRVARAVRSGTFGVNTYTVTPHTPFGGYKTSGIGREGGAEGIEAFTELKTVTIALTDSPI